MTQVEVLSADRDPAGGYKVDVGRGQRVGSVSSEWFSRPADERYLSLSDLYYGRIFDHELVAAVQRIAGNGTGDTRWKVPGVRHALGERPDVAFLAALHVLTLKTFYHYGSDSCLELELKSVSFGTQAPGLNDSASAEAIRARHESWAKALPKESADVWDALQEWDGDSQAALFAHIVSLSVNAVYEPWNRRPRAVAHADRLAQAVDLDMAAAGWTPTVDNFLGRVTKARILQAVSQAKGQRAADRIEHLKKGDMAAEAETLLADTAWLPEPLRTPGRTVEAEPAPESAVEETAEQAGEKLPEDDDEPVAHNDDADEPMIAAE